MRFIFKTDYAQDVNLAKHGGHVFWYSALMLLLLAAPWIFAEYWLAQLTLVLIYSIAGLGLMLLAGFTGLFSMGHAAFLGVGAYTHTVLTNMGVPFPFALACAASLSAAVGLLVACPLCGSKAFTSALPPCRLVLLWKRCWHDGNRSLGATPVCTSRSRTSSAGYSAAGNSFISYVW